MLYKQIQTHYRNQCQAMISAVEELLPRNSYQYTLPAGGMFLWIKFPHVKKTSFELFEELANANVICVAGDHFLVPGLIPDKSRSPAVRVTFAAASPERIRLGISKLADYIKTLH